ncbi:hypothetical protein [Beijerinckia mobilis]|uniref:hypothetical protein n=1 Tax=Beijerinckia mobilis TaxID=231434 RepID=UPI000553DC5E|nr:hypothetical protein [Beijerinckia mobilis]
MLVQKGLKYLTFNHEAESVICVPCSIVVLIASMEGALIPALGTTLLCEGATLSSVSIHSDAL